MKELMLFIIFITISQNIVAQDNIVKKDGSEIKSKIVEIDPKIIQYKRFDNIDGPIYSIRKSEVFIIQYENGTKDNFKTEPSKNKKELHVDTITKPSTEIVRSNSTKDTTVIENIKTTVVTKERSDDLIIDNYIFVANSLRFKYSPAKDRYSTFTLGTDVELGGVFYFAPQKMPKHVGIGLNFTLINVGLMIGGITDTPLQPYNGNLGPQVSFRVAKNTMLDIYAKAGLSLIYSNSTSNYNPQPLVEAGIHLRYRVLTVGFGTFIYPNNSDFNQIKLRFGISIPYKIKRKPTNQTTS